MNKKKIGQAIGMVLVIAMVCVFWRLIDFLPIIGDPGSAPNAHVSKLYIIDGPSITHSPNLVTGVLADFRGFDTLWETTVMLLAGIAVSMILSDKLKRHWDSSIFGKIRSFGGPDVKAMIPLVVPFILLYAVHHLGVLHCGDNLWIFRPLESVPMQYPNFSQGIKSKSS